MSTVVLRVRVAHAPARAGVSFGLQDKAGVLARGRSHRDGSMTCLGEVRAEQSGDGGKPNCLGNLTHGPRSRRHLYLSLRHSDDGGWVKRIKLPLDSITWDMIGAAQDGVLENGGRWSGGCDRPDRLASGEVV